MAAYSQILIVLREYFISLGYEEEYISRYFSERTFSELLSVKLANANVVIRNKTDRNSHQTHIAIVGEAADFFGGLEAFHGFTKYDVKMLPVSIVENNLIDLSGQTLQIDDPQELKLLHGYVTIGVRTQKQLQLSKKCQKNSACFNDLRNLLYEKDLLVMLKFRSDDTYLCVGIPGDFLEKLQIEYDRFYETNTYLKLPYKM